ncbi:MAG: PAS domain S-box protein [Methanoregula sp.]|jgi:PAS domain S-box-containing protein|nr:PAS domain S-box protein [Methanoregula sp.]
MVLSSVITSQIKDILKKNPRGINIIQIASETGINRNTVGRYLENLLVSGQVEMRRFGMEKIYTLSLRVPFSAVLSISSELVLQLDSNLRIIYANEPFLKLVGADSKNLMGKNIEYTPVAFVFNDLFTGFVENIKGGVSGQEWSGEIVLHTKNINLFCRIAPTVFDDGRKGVTVILEDITSRKKAEQKVEESERQFRLLAENSLDMIGRMKPDYTHTYVSPAYTTTLGYLPEEIIGKRGQLFIHPEDAHTKESGGNVLTPQNSSETIRFRAKHKDGHYIWVESTVRAIFDEKTRELSEYYAVTRDITERKRTEDALRESEATARALINAPTDSVILMDTQGIILALNETAAARFGKRSDELIGILADDLLPKMVAKTRKMLITQVLEKKEMVRFEDERDGRWFDTVAYPVVNDTGEVNKIAIIARDITDRRNTEEAFLQREQRFRHLITAIRDIVWETDAQARFVYVSPQVEAILGYKPDELIGHGSLEFLHPEAISLTEKKFRTSETRQEKSVLHVSRWIHKDGHDVFLESNAVPTFNSNGSFSGFIGIDRKR